MAARGQRYRLRRRSPVQQNGVFRRPGVGFVWLGLALLVAVDAVIGLSGTGTLSTEGLNDAILWAATAVCFAGALRATRSRGAWLLVATGLASWALGDTIWSIRFSGDANAPLTSV